MGFDRCGMGGFVFCVSHYYYIRSACCLRPPPHTTPTITSTMYYRSMCRYAPPVTSQLILLWSAMYRPMGKVSIADDGSTSVYTLLRNNLYLALNKDALQTWSVYQYPPSIRQKRNRHERRFQGSVFFGGIPAYRQTTLKRLLLYFIVAFISIENRK